MCLCRLCIQGPGEWCFLPEEPPWVKASRRSSLDVAPYVRFIQALCRPSCVFHMPNNILA